MELEQWKEKYFNKEIVNVNEEFSDKEKSILQLLGVEIKNKLYTEYEFEKLDGIVLSFYYDDSMSDDEKKECKLLPEGVNREEYNNLVDKIHDINSKYEF